jgi:hypothetical protein
VTLGAHGCTLAVLWVTMPGVAAAQRCDAPHYRWPQKIDTTLRAMAPRDVTIGAILNDWPVPPIGNDDADRCHPRVAAERSVYHVVGWLRRIDRKKDDGDWHLEMTERRDDNVGACIVVEIPLPAYHPTFGRARAAVDSLLRSTRIERDGDLVKPIHIVVTGASFFDGEHLGKKRRLVARDHGRCNSSVRALWEIHPVYDVQRVR